MNCTKCGQNLPEGSRFCEHCGAPVRVDLPKSEVGHQPSHQQGSSGDAIGRGGVRREVILGNQPEAKNTAKPWVWIIGVVLIVLSCCCIAVIGGGWIYLRDQDMAWQEVLPSGLEATTIVPEVSATTPVPEEAGQPIPQVETEELQNELSQEYILAVTSSGIWAVNEQTHEAAQISQAPLDAPWEVQEGLSPDRKFFAYITGYGGASVNPMLIVLDIENLTAILQLELTGPLVQPGIEETHGDPGFEASRAMQFGSNLAWSPDATRLAFVAARDDESADVYLFDRSDNSVTRLTDEAGHAANLHWSPGGQLLQYLSIHTFGTGAGAVMEGLWAYDFQNHQAQLLETLESNGEEFLGWTDNSHFLMASWSPICESYNLRLVNAGRLLSQVIVDGCFTGIAYDSVQKHGLFAVTEFNTENCSCGQPLDAGLMLFGEGVGYPVAGEFGYKKFELLNAYTVRFIPQGNLFLIFGDDGQPFIFNDQLSNMDIPAEVSGLAPYASPTGDNWAWSSHAQSGLWITERNMNPVELSALFSGVPLWSPDGQTIYFYEFNRLFSASAPQFDTGTLVVEVPGDILGLVR